MRKKAWKDMNSKWYELKQQIVSCRKCPLSKTRIHPVVGEGRHDSFILFVGEAPGAEEDKTGRPFCGRSGSVLDELLKATGLKRQQVYITNIVKCRPPNNRNPLDNEIKACTPYLNCQIELIKPLIICCLGNFATRYVMQKYGLEEKIQAISKIHGRIFFGSSKMGSVKIVPLYHPAVATYNINMKPLLIKDFLGIKNILT